MAPPFVERRTHVEEARFGEVAAASNGEERDEAVVIRIAVHRDDAFALLALREQNGAHSEHETLRLKGDAGMEDPVFGSKHTYLIASCRIWWLGCCLPLESKVMEQESRLRLSRKATNIRYAKLLSWILLAGGQAAILATLPVSGYWQRNAS